MAFLEVKNVKKVYTTRFGTNKVEALKNVNFTAERVNTLQSWVRAEAVRQRF